MSGAKSTPTKSLCSALGTYHFILLQETWLQDSEKSIIQNALPSHRITVKCGFDIHQPVSRGRPKGGLAICIKDFTGPITDLCLDSPRILALRVEYPSIPIVLVNVYFPCNNTGTLAEFVECLDQLTVLFQNHSDASFILGGDLNCDIRDRNKIRGSLLDEFCHLHSLSPRLPGPNSELSNSYNKLVLNQTHSSLIDWFCVSDHLTGNITSPIIHSIPVLNSEHSPVSLLFFPPSIQVINRSIDSMTNENSAAGFPTAITPRVYSNRMSRDDWFLYQFQADIILGNITPPHDAVSCTSNCTINSHKKELNSYFKNIVNGLSTAFKSVTEHLEVNPRGVNNNKHRTIPGWKTEIRPLQAIMFLHHKEWKASGLDTNCDLYTRYSLSRRNYHAAVKTTLKNDKEMRSRAIINRLSTANNSKAFWNTLKKSFPNRRTQTAPTQNGSTPDPKTACNIWSKMFSKDFSLYSTASSSNDLISSCRAAQNNQPSNSSCFDQNLVQMAMNQLSLNKAPGPDNILSEMIAFAPLSLAVHLSLFFRSCERHAYLPEGLSEAHIHPVPKPHKNPSVFENYRPITIGSTLGKVFERCIFLSYREQLTSSNLQFGFKPKLCTSHCTLTAKAVAKHFTDNGSRVFAALLDASKAFDRINFPRTFHKLLFRGIPATVVLLLHAWYVNTKINVTWRNEVSSDSFGIDHGVRQGGLLSPALFSIIYDDLLAELELTGMGCHIRSRFVGALAYADDIILLAPSLLALNVLLKTCHKWSLRNNLLFNPHKSVSICFSGKLRHWPKDRQIPVYLGNDLIPSSELVTHLGHKIQFDLNEAPQINDIARNFNRQFHGFYQRFSDLKKRELLIPLYNSYCTSFYGIQSTFFSRALPSATKFLNKSVNLALMKLLKLPLESVSPFLISEGILNADSCCKYRSLCFWKNLSSSVHPFKDIILAAFRCDVIQLCLQSNIIPGTLRNMSHGRINDTVINNWIASKIWN